MCPLSGHTFIFFLLIRTFVLLIRACEEEGKARMGLVECLNHNLVEPFNVLYERDGETQCMRCVGLTECLWFF